MDGRSYSGLPRSFIYNGREAFVKLGHLAILKEFRKVGVSKLLIDSALTVAHDYPYVIADPLSASFKEELRDTLGEILDMNTDWNVLVLIHSPLGLQKFWARRGVQLDEGLGIREEEGIDHVAMWKRLDLKAAAQATAPYSYTEEPKRFRGIQPG